MYLTNIYSNISLTGKKTCELLSREIIDECRSQNMTKAEIQEKYNVSQNCVILSIRKANKEKEELLIQRFKELNENGNRTNKEIADILGVSRGVIDKLRKKLGLHKRETKKNMILELFEQNLPIEEIKKRLNLKQSTSVVNALIDKGVKLKQIRMQKKYHRLLQFIELKKQGLTLDQIAETLHVPQPVLSGYIRESKKILAPFVPAEVLGQGISNKELLILGKYKRLMLIIEEIKNGLSMVEIAKKLNISFTTAYREYNLKKEILSVVERFNKISGIL